MGRVALGERALPLPDGGTQVFHRGTRATTRGTLGVTEPDPVAATAAQIAWLWEHRAEAAAVPA